MQQKTTTPRRKLHRRQVVAYYRESPTGDDGASVAVQREIIATWAVENSHEIVEEVIERMTGPIPDMFIIDAMVEQHVTRRGDVLYVIRMSVALWRRWRRGEMSLFFHNLSKHPGDRAVFVTTDKDIADGLPFRIHAGSCESCCSHGHRIRKALAWHRAKRAGNRNPRPQLRRSTYFGLRCGTAAAAGSDDAAPTVTRTGSSIVLQKQP